MLFLHVARHCNLLTCVCVVIWSYLFCLLGWKHKEAGASDPLLLPQTVGWENVGGALGLNKPHCGRRDLWLLRSPLH